ncbi:MAG: hypothetical protein mread185_000535 [Mycoplasmataceae bacterium]|nr:MAG: hypothetical protein mread185_000535 [Mycoplasmataceae bacterium]
MIDSDKVKKFNWNNNFDDNSIVMRIEKKGQNWDIENLDDDFSSETLSKNNNNSKKIHSDEENYPDDDWFGNNEYEEEIDCDAVSQDAESPEEDNEEFNVNEEVSYQEDEYQDYEKAGGW